MTGSEINHSFLFHGVLKNLTACGMLRISIARCQIEPEIHSFPTMYIMGGGNNVRNGSNRWFCPKNRPQIMFFSGHKSGSSNFGYFELVVSTIKKRWPNYLKCRFRVSCTSLLKKQYRKDRKIPCSDLMNQLLLLLVILLL